MHQIGHELQDALTSLGVPLRVVDGPEFSETTTWGRERIVLGYDDDSADAFERPDQAKRSTRLRYIARDACKITIYAQSTTPGARTWEHRQRVKLVRDKVLVALDIVSARRNNRWAPTSGRLFTPADLAATELPRGAAYELRFWFDRGVDTRPWSGTSTPVAVVGPGGVGITSTTQVSLETGDPLNESPTGDTACTTCGCSGTGP